jgi:hypothetical protein
MFRPDGSRLLHHEWCANRKSTSSDGLRGIALVDIEAVKDDDGNIVGFNPKVFLAKVGTGKTISKYQKDQIIFAQGDSADTIFYLQKGKVKIVLTSDQGKEAVVGIIEPDQFFGKVVSTANHCASRRLWRWKIA